MPINVYTGLMGSGKSYEVVSSVILEAIAKGRRVVTNVDGISHDRVRGYLVEKRDLPIERLGEIVHVTNDDVFKPDFFPYYDDVKSAHIDTIVQPGDLVCVDEAWRFWGTDSKIHKNHKSFFLEHRHFTHSETGVACDLVLMIQDMGTLHRFVKVVVAFSFRTHKKVSLGLSKVYSIQMFEGWKQNSKTETGNWVRTYKKEIFPLYQSFKDGAEGKSVNADARQNILRNPKLWFVAFGTVALLSFGSLNAWRFFHRQAPHQEEANGSSQPAKSPVASDQTAPKPSASSAQHFSETWRVVGQYDANGDTWVVVANDAGRLRVESPSLFHGYGTEVVGEVDGDKVSRWSGQLNRSAAAPAVQVGGVGK